jgi:hypothetical protein
MDCKACRREIDLAARGEEVQAEEARAHLSSCAGCREFRSERVALRELIASVEPAPAPPDFDWKLRARLAADRSIRSGSNFRLGFAPGVQAITLAAAFVLLIAAAVYFKQARTESLSPTPTVATAHVPATNTLGIRQTDSVQTNVSAESLDNSGGSTNMQRTSARSNVRSGRALQVKSNVPGRELSAQAVAAVGTASLRSNDFSSGVAPIITLFSVPVRTPTQPVKVLLDEGRGTLRTVALQPVTFGSQEILRRSSGGDAPSRQDRGAEEIW